MKNITPPSTRFGQSPVPRWLTDDGIEVVDHFSAPHSHLTHEERFCATAPNGTYARGATKELAVHACRANLADTIKHHEHIKGFIASLGNGPKFAVHDTGDSMNTIRIDVSHIGPGFYRAWVMQDDRCIGQGSGSADNYAVANAVAEARFTRRGKLWYTSTPRWQPSRKR